MRWSTGNCSEGDRKVFKGMHFIHAHTHMEEDFTEQKSFESISIYTGKTVNSTHTGTCSVL